MQRLGLAILLLLLAYWLLTGVEPTWFVIADTSLIILGRARVELHRLDGEDQC